MRRAILIALFTLVGLNAVAQSGVYHVEGLSSQHSIVREYGQNRAIVYSQDPSSSGFSLLDFNTMTATYAELPLGTMVNDFEIIGSEVYLCCTHGSIPFVGHFKISDLFGGTDDYYFHRLILRAPGHEIVCPEKIAVYSVGGENHAVVVGAGRLIATDTVAERFVMDVHHDPSMPHSITGQAIFNGSSPEHFYDVAATDNYIVVIADKEDGNAHYIRAFDKPTVAGNDIFSTTTWHTYYHSQGDYFPVSEFCHTEPPLSTLRLSSKDGKTEKYWLPNIVRSGYVSVAPAITTLRIINECH